MATTTGVNAVTVEGAMGGGMVDAVMEDAARGEMVVAVTEDAAMGEMVVDVTEDAVMEDVEETVADVHEGTVEVDVEARDWIPTMHPPSRHYRFGDRAWGLGAQSCMGQAFGAAACIS